MNTEELKKLALAATPGPWKGGQSAVWSEDGNGPVLFHRDNTADCMFIAAANPTAMLAMIERLEKAEQQRDELLASAESFRDSVLHQRWNLEDNGMSSEQINDVLNLFDMLVGDEIAKVGA